MQNHSHFRSVTDICGVACPQLKKKSDTCLLKSCGVGRDNDKKKLTKYLNWSGNAKNGEKAE